MEIKGIDISEYQTDIDFEQVRAAGIGYVMIRTGYGAEYADKMLRSHVAGASGAGLPYGFYHYSYALTPAEAEEEAEFALGLVKDFKPTMPFAYDVEDVSQRGLSPEELSAVADAFLARVARAGCYPMLYSYLRRLAGDFTPQLLGKYDVWLAQWASAPDFDGSFGMWQYSASGRVPGIASAVDLDVAYRDYPAIIAGMEPPEPVPRTDNIPDGYAKAAVEKAVARKLLLGDAGGDLMLHSPLSRQDFCVLADRLGLLDV